MNKAEYTYRKLVIWGAKRVPVESPGWATLGVFAPNVMSWLLVRGTLTSLDQHPLVGRFFTETQLQWGEWAIHGVMAAVGLSFLCRLLQICAHKYYDKYKVDESL